jgi:hypothetical protein
MGAAADCEAILDSWWGQPVNTATAFAFVVGALVIAKGKQRVTAALLVAFVGVGSIAFHGPMPKGAELAHDISIMWVLAWILLTETGNTRWWLPVFALTGLASATPAVADPSQSFMAAAVILSQVRRPNRRRLLALGVLAAGAIVGTLSRTGGPLCNPNSLLQGHGLWHLASAAALTIWALNHEDGVGRVDSRSWPVGGRHAGEQGGV